MNQNCKTCGRPLRPAPARFDGVPTFVGYFPCPCNESFMTDCGIIEPHTPEHDAMMKRYDEKISFSVL